MAELNKLSQGAPGGYPKVDDQVIKCILYDVIILCLISHEANEASSNQVEHLRDFGEDFDHILIYKALVAQC